ncbi:hypothetical protein QBC33DRAFT_377381 [Phialemonium atrogriseum]|uniref:Uncharacterized protein n=1 Tax=Phialemonium atrogriseum TaxID=1093897 RepID=A0AAJ0C495_9PEZI|nr:uncharacterized protein QBC33DRAFT_377381 [Phialemonium atrogriseum]KAK1768439.1 hypothetical protein QBC33DRAFT_377381 [Phialemonium atrogriseum]
MAVGQWSYQTIRCGEDIALLSLLNQLPSRPSVNLNRPLQGRDDRRRSLSFDNECCLASSLAFLAGPFGDPNHVIALSVEEVSASKAVKVVIAINKQAPSDGVKILERIKVGFESVFSVLARARPDSNENVYRETLSAVVSMTRRQILLRVGSKRPGLSSAHNKKTLFGDIVQTIIDVVRQRRRLRGEAALFLEKSVILKDSLDALETCDASEVDARLKEMITAASRLNRAVDIPRLLQDIPPNLLNPSTREGFSRRLGKLARYRECSRYLYQTAKTFDIFAEATVIPISLSEEHLARVPERLDNPNFLECFSRCKNGAKLRLDTLCRKLGTTEPNIAQQFVTQASKAFNESKIHAEIQILSYYELSHPVENTPRVICSNKDACYLCNAFIRLHGQFHIPASHGRLYPAWRLPNLPVLLDLQVQLNLFLEAQILTESKKLLGSARRAATMLPNESTIFPISTSLSTILSSARSQHEDPLVGPLNEQAQNPPRATRTSHPTTPIQLSPQLLAAGEPHAAALDMPNSSVHLPPPGETSNTSLPDNDKPTPPVPSKSSTPTPTPSPPPTGSEITPLTRGQPTTTRTIIGGHAAATRGYSAGSLTVFLEVPRSRSRELSIEWLLPEEDEEDDNHRAVDARSMPEAVDVDSGSRDCVVLACGLDVVRIRVRAAV